MDATDPQAQRRRERFVTWASALPEHVWQDVVDEVHRRRTAD